MIISHLFFLYYKTDFERLIHILENIGNDKLAQCQNYKLRVKVRNKVKKIRRDTLTLEKELY